MAPLPPLALLVSIHPSLLRGPTGVPLACAPPLSLNCGNTSRSVLQIEPAAVGPGWHIIAVVVAAAEEDVFFLGLGSAINHGPPRMKTGAGEFLGLPDELSIWDWSSLPSERKHRNRWRQRRPSGCLWRSRSRRGLDRRFCISRRAMQMILYPLWRIHRNLCFQHRHKGEFCHQPDC